VKETGFAILIGLFSHDFALARHESGHSAKPNIKGAPEPGLLEEGVRR
jgi:hypothetical protein